MYSYSHSSVTSAASRSAPEWLIVDFPSLLPNMRALSATVAGSCEPKLPQFRFALNAQRHRTLSEFSVVKSKW